LDLTVHNIVATSTVSVRLPLSLLDESLPEAEYDPEHFFALIYRSHRHRVSVLANASGKIVVVGGKSVADLEGGRDEFVAAVRRCGIQARPNPIEVVNIVASGRLHFRPNLEDVARRAARLAFVREILRSTALVIKQKGPRCPTIALHSTGAFLVSGAKNATELNSATHFLSRLLPESEDKTVGRRSQLEKSAAEGPRGM